MTNSITCRAWWTFHLTKEKACWKLAVALGLISCDSPVRGAIVTGIDLSTTAIDLARKNIEQNELNADLRVMNGESMQFADNSFDVVYAHGVLQYTADARKNDGRNSQGS